MKTETLLIWGILLYLIFIGFKPKKEVDVSQISEQNVLKKEGLYSVNI